MTDLTRLRYILFIQGQQGLVTLEESLKYTRNIICVVPKGFSNTKIVNLCLSHKIKVLKRAKDQQIDVKEYNCDVLISSQFQFRIHKKEFKALSKGAINIHASILPKYKGKHSDVWALINDEKILGITVHKINEEFDDGEILHIEKIKINDSMTNKEIYQTILELLPKIIKLIFNNLIFKNTIKNKGQDIFWRARNLSDSRINWNLNCRKVFLFIRALAREPIYAYSSYKGETYQFLSCRITDCKENKLVPGTVVEKSGELYVVCGDAKLLRIIEYNSKKRKDLKQKYVLH